MNATTRTTGSHFFIRLPNIAQAYYSRAMPVNTSKDARTLQELGLTVGVHARGPRNHLVDVPGGIGVSHRTFRDPARGVCTGFTVIQPTLGHNERRAAA